MSVLRVRFEAAPDPTTRVAWVLSDDRGMPSRTGYDAPRHWPDAERLEAVIAAAQVRVVALQLPTLPTARVRPAAAFAVEDQIAGPPEAQHVAVSRQAPDGRVRVVVVERALLQAIALLPQRCSGLPVWSRIVAEPELAPVGDAWQWCIDGGPTPQGFVRFTDGSAIATSAPSAEGELPDDLAQLLARHCAPAAGIVVHGSAPANVLAHWSATTGCRFVAGAPWTWQSCADTAWAAATSLLQGDFAPKESAPRRAPRRGWRPALLLAAAALGVHVVATVGEWLALRLDARADTRAWQALARSAGIVEGAAGGGAGERAALARRYAELRHANGLAAPGDALPMLARAAPTLGRLPPGALKGATFSAGAWTLELGAVDAEAWREFDAGMKAAGLPALVARTSAGSRARFGGSGS